MLMNIQRNDKVGRYATAGCDFNPGDVIFSETPFAFGPKSDSPPICLGCCTPVDGLTFCSGCGWPVCSVQCETMPAHKNAECAVFSRARALFQTMPNFSTPCLQYECVTPLRVLLAIESNPERWNQEVKEMESHNALRKEKPIWRFNQINIVNYLRGPCKLKDSFSEELIHAVCGILESNAFEARSISGHPIRCLFPKLAILSHNCVSNISHSIVCTGTGDTSDFRVTVRAARKVQEGEELFSSYTYSLWPTLTRREHLKESKYFDCCCARCSDPTEMGTHMSTLKCNKCEKGLITSINPLDADAKWKCSNCENTRTSKDIQNLFTNIQTDLDAADNSQREIRTELLEKLVQKYESVLHPSNAYFCMIRSSLAHLYGKPSSTLMSNCSTLLLERKVDFCKQLLKVLDVVEPGYTRIRGITLFELYTALARVLKSDKLGLQLLELIRVLEESTAILKLEPKSNFEGKLGIIANKSLSQLKEHFQDAVEGNLDISNVTGHFVT